MEQDCAFCGELPSEERDDRPTTLVKEYNNWTTVLSFNQYYPGRCIVLLNRHIVDFFDLEPSERESLFETVVPELREALQALFDPDLFNYASLGNDVRHLHLHVIPRYSGPREIDGVRFMDENWGSHYKPYPDDFTIPDETFDRIRTGLRDALA